MTNERDDQTRAIVRDHYGKIAEGDGSCAPGCCGANPAASVALGYDAAELAALPDGANLGLGCGNPQALAALRAGEVVLDLGAGGGIDCFLAHKRVGPEGRVIGVDMTPAMLLKARAAARRMGATNVEFRLGEIEHLPVADQSVDVILSNCVINLSPDKAQVFRDAFRVLRPGGRLCISDVVATAALPEALRSDASLSGCVAGAAAVPELQAMLRDAGFADVVIDVDVASREFIKDWFPGLGVERYVASAKITARRTSPCCGSAGCGQ